MSKLRFLYSTARSLLVALAASGAVGASPAMAQSSPDDLAWQAAQQAGTVEALQRYLEAFPVGKHAGEAFRLIIALSEAEGLVEPAAGDVAGAAGTGDLY